MWSHNHWQHSIYGAGCRSAGRLERYAQIFNTVEGNTSFYATPASHTVNNWHAATPDSFRFTFKLPQTITHRQQLQHCDKELRDFFSVMTPLIGKTGIWKIQLPAHFGPEALPLLAGFLERLPAGLPLGVEVRHPAFFAKGEAERALNRLLIDTGCNRILMDSRPLFALPPLDTAIKDAQQKKPRLPVHAIATAANPIIRFIGQPDDAVALLAQANPATKPLRDNDAFFDNWLQQLPRWLADGKQPYLFIHTPDNAGAPELALRLYQKLRHRLAMDAEFAQTKVSLPEPALLPAEAAAANPQLGLEW